jgi:CBS domain-containing protein
MRVGDVCSRDVETVRWDETAFVAAQRMRARGADALVVVSGSGQPVGLICNRDFVCGLVADGRDPARTVVSDLMSAPPPVRASCAIETALRSMLSDACRRLPVVDDTGALCGLVSFDDVVRVIAGDAELLGAVLRRTSKQRVA